MIYKRGCDKKGPGSSCSKCGKRGSCGVYWYKFMWQGKLVRKSSKQGNDKSPDKWRPHTVRFWLRRGRNSGQESCAHANRILREAIRAVD